MKISNLPLTSLVPDPDQPRQTITKAELDSLASSIRERGLLLPLRVKPADAAGRHVIVSGHRRYAALLRLGGTEAPCIITDGPLDEAAVLAEQLAENQIRQNLNPIEEAGSYRRYLDLKRITAAQAALELHVDATRISRFLPLLELPDAVRRAVATGALSQETAYYLTRLPDGDERTRLFDRALAGDLGRDEAARAVRAARTPAHDPAANPVGRITCRLPGGRSLTLCAGTVHLAALIETLEEALKAARKARRQGLDVSTLAKVLRDTAAPKAGGA